MSIIIKGMNIPSSCMECPLFNRYGCTATNTVFCNMTNVAVMTKGCPLIEIPKGARLIDAKELYMDIIHRFDYCDDFLEMLENAPTIFEEEQHERKSSRH